MIPTLAAGIWLISALTTWPDGKDNPPHVTVTYDSRKSFEECEKDRHRMALAGHAPGVGVAMFCSDETTKR